MPGTGCTPAGSAEWPAGVHRTGGRGRVRNGWVRGGYSMGTIWGGGSGQGLYWLPGSDLGSLLAPRFGSRVSGVKWPDLGSPGSNGQISQISGQTGLPTGLGT